MLRLRTKNHECVQSPKFCRNFTRHVFPLRRQSCTFKCKHQSYPEPLTTGHPFCKQPLQTEPPGSPSCYNHASQDILGEGRKLLKLLDVENEMEDSWTEYPWDMWLSVVKKDPGKDTQNTAGTGCNYCNKRKCGTWSLIPPWNWSNLLVSLKPMFTTHLI